MPSSRPPLLLCPEATAAMFLAPLLPRRRCLAARLLPALALLAALWFSLTARGEEDWNARVLAQVRAMPSGGGYRANRLAADRLAASVDIRGGALVVQPALASPNFCSEATYLVFLKTIQPALTRLDPATLDALLVRNQPDGHGVWGRWNANGPGTARLFRELGLGRNFDDFAQARPGDFLKIFWSPEVGRRERGHSVIFLGCEPQGGVECVRFWSSNVPGGYGEKVVPRSRIAYAIFSRLEHPEALSRLAGIPPICPYLARLGSARSSRAEARTMAGM
ncbi:MAG: hypothetical protein WCH57_02265 [Verrucomicrobiota bacterium]